VKIIPRILLGASLCATLSFSGIITGVSVIINDEPITLYEVYKYSQKFKISKKESLNLLVRQKLEESQIKKFGIDADTFEVDQYIEHIANNNGMSQYEFFNMLKSKDIKINDYKKEIKAKIKKDKLYQRIFAGKLGSIDESEVEKFYKSNPEQFRQANSFDVTSYTSTNGNNLIAIIKNPMLRPSAVQIEDKEIPASALSNQLKALLNQTKDGTFSKITTIKNQKIMFFVKEKKDFITLPYDKVKQSIYRVLSQQKEQAILKDYFEKIKASATIEVVRSPA